MDVQSDGEGARFNLDSAMLKNGNFDGFTPTILNVTPIRSLPVFLGEVAESRELVGAEA